jgi:hypothetical protein
MKNSFIAAINAGHFSDAKCILKTFSRKETSHFLTDLTFETNLISIYTFILFLLLEKETVGLHECAISILLVSLWEGANASAFLHARRITELDPHDINHKQHLLFYFRTPGCNMTKEEAKNIAQEILLQDPQNTVALQTIKDISLIEKQRHS